MWWCTGLDEKKIWGKAHRMRRRPLMTMHLRLFLESIYTHYNLCKSDFFSLVKNHACLLASWHSCTPVLLTWSLLHATLAVSFCVHHLDSFGRIIYFHFLRIWDKKDDIRTVVVFCVSIDINMYLIIWYILELSKCTMIWWELRLSDCEKNSFPLRLLFA